MKSHHIYNIIAKVLVLLLLATSLNPTATVFAQEEEAVITIYNTEEFLAFVDNCVLDTWSQGKTVSLQADISLEGVTFSGIPTFGGIFEGNGYEISDVDMTAMVSPAGFFCVLQESAVVRNLKVTGSVVPCKCRIRKN